MQEALSVLIFSLMFSVFFLCGQWCCFRLCFLGHLSSPASVHLPDSPLLRLRPQPGKIPECSLHSFLIEAKSVSSLTGSDYRAIKHL